MFLKFGDELRKFRRKLVDKKFLKNVPFKKITARKMDFHPKYPSWLWRFDDHDDASEMVSSCFFVYYEKKEKSL